MGIEVFIWGMRVGVLVRLSDGIAFQYDPEFKKTGLDLSPINLPLEGKDRLLRQLARAGKGRDG